MKFKLLSFLLFISVESLIFADQELSEYKNLTEEKTNTQNRLMNPAFDEGDKGIHWTLGREAEISASHGRNQRGLGIKRTDPSRYSVHTQKVKLKPGTKYIAGCWIRNEGFDPKLKKGGSFGIEWYRGNNHLSSAYCNSTGNHDWKLYTREFTTSNDPDLEYVIVLFLGKGYLGTTSYDDVFIQEVGAAWLPVLVSPFNAVMKSGNGTVEISTTILGSYHYSGSNKAALSCFADLKYKGKTVKTKISRIKNNRAIFDFGTLAAGEYELDLALLDTANKLILAKRDAIHFHVMKPSDYEKREVYIDEHGRMIVKGKPFLPVGLYAGGTNAEDLSFWEKSPFNFVMPYGGPKLKYPGEWKRNEDTANLRRALDRLKSKNLRFACNLIASYPDLKFILKNWDGDRVRGINESVDAISDAVKNHPAMMVYYTCDELPAKRGREIEARRMQLHRRDSNHPTLAAYFQYPDLPYYGNGQDILGLIFYPVVGPKSDNMELILSNLDAARRIMADRNGNMSVWAIAQAFNWGTYVKDRKRFEKDYRFPTEAEMTAMGVLAAIEGVKGFLFYSYQELRYRNGCLSETEKLIEFCDTWPAVCSMGKTIRELEPYLLSLRKAPQIKLKVIKGKVRAKAFLSDDGKSIRVLIAGVGPGEAEAIVEIPGWKNLDSLTGNSKNCNGKYRFQGKNICYDILKNK